MYFVLTVFTTVGFGDMTPRTVFGKIFASIIMLMGFAMIAVPTGIVTVEIAHAARRSVVSTVVCKECSQEGHDPDAVHCKYCGAKL